MSIGSSFTPVSRVTPPQIDDPSQYTRIPRVPILDRHLRKIVNPETGEVRVTACDEEQLHVISDNTNKRISRGDIPIVTIGHTDKKKPEVEQPPLVGYFKDFVVGTHNDEPTILADLYIENQYIKDKETSILRQFPRRSVEVWHKEQPTAYIDVLALLKRAPERDLGLITYQKDVEYFECHCDDKEELEMADDEPDASLEDQNSAAEEAEESEKPDNDAEVSALCKTIAKHVVEHLKSDNDFHELIAKAAVEHHLNRDEFIDNLISRINDLLESSAQESEEEKSTGVPETADSQKEYMDAAASAPSGTNTMIPSADTEEVEKMSKNADPNIQIGVLTAQLEAANKVNEKLTQRIEALEIRDAAQQEQFRKTTRRTRLENIRRSGVDINVDEELETFEKFDDSTFEIFAKRAETNYARIPIDQPRLFTADVSHIPSAPATNEGLDLTEKEVNERAVEKFAKANNIPLDSPDAGIEAVRQYFEKADRSKYGIRKKA